MSEAIPALMLSEIGQIAVVVRDIDRAVVFYRDTLGMRLLFRPPRLAFFACGSIRLMLGLPEKSEFDHPASIIYYKVADIDSACRTLRERGVELEGEPHLVAKMPDHDLWIAFFRDPDRNLLGLMCERRG
jgi:catechol 2,3-dioxygenase-like lactoylglutathione lyase family enzyme